MELAIGKLANTAGGLLCERGNLALNAQEQEKLQLAAAGDVPTETGVLLKIMTEAHMCVWVGGWCISQSVSISCRLLL